jgi:hypothetical protein
MGQQLAERLVGRRPRVEPGGRLPEEDRQGGAGHGRPDGPEASAANARAPQAATSAARTTARGPFTWLRAPSASRQPSPEPTRAAAYRRPARSGHAVRARPCTRPRRRRAPQARGGRRRGARAGRAPERSGRGRRGHRWRRGGRRRWSPSRPGRAVAAEPGSGRAASAGRSQAPSRSRRNPGGRGSRRGRRSGSRWRSRRAA